MADTISKPKMQLRNGISVNGVDRTPSPQTKLLINHGKPNFTIQRSPKVQQNGNTSPLTIHLQNNGGSPNGSISPTKTNGSTYSSTNGSTNSSRAPSRDNSFVVRSTKFNGVITPGKINVTEKQAHQQTTGENEMSKVVLRRTRVAEPVLKEGEDESVPEFIRRQRRIQERLAKENVLDFENRRSGYFTHVMISPSSPNRTSFVETMSSPAIVPALEIPPPKPKVEEPISTPVAVVVEEKEEVEHENESNGGSVEHAVVAAVVTSAPLVEEKQEEIKTEITNGNNQVEEEEVAKAIEEVNKAVAGEDDTETGSNILEPTDQTLIEEPVAVATTLPHFEETESVVEKKESKKEEVVATIEHVEETKVEEKKTESTPMENGQSEKMQNGDSEVTISHTNGSEVPSIPSPNPSGDLGVNYEPKTVVSFSKDLGSEPNKYPDTVKVVKDGELVPVMSADAELQEMAKLKFDIKADEQDVQVTPVLRTD